MFFMCHVIGDAVNEAQIKHIALLANNGEDCIQIGDISIADAVVIDSDFKNSLHEYMELVSKIVPATVVAVGKGI